VRDLGSEKLPGAASVCAGSAAVAEHPMRKAAVASHLCVLLFTRGWAVDEIV
jgi:hypothetical protein